MAEEAAAKATHVRPVTLARGANVVPTAEIFIRQRERQRQKHPTRSSDSDPTRLVVENWPRAFMKTNTRSAEILHHGAKVSVEKRSQYASKENNMKTILRSRQK